MRPLRTPEDRQRYLETKGVIETLKEVIADNAPGADHLFEPVDIGLSSRNALEAVQVYKWIEGRDLSDRHAALSPESVIDIGIKLSRTLALLHKHNVLHRDICPRNIILADTDAETLRPVLIDFGFARISEGHSATVFAGEHVAPEVRTTPAAWSKAADVYALGWTLRWLVAANSDAAELADCLDRTLVSEPARRITAEALMAELAALGEQASVEQRQQDALRTIKHSLTPEDRHSPWIAKLIRENQSSLVGLEMGFSRDQFDRCRSITDFLNKVTETCPTARNARLRDIQTRLSGEDGLAVGYVWALRNDRSHARDAQNEWNKRQVEAFRGLKSAQQRELVTRAAAHVGKACRFLSLEAMVHRFLQK